MTPQAPSHYYTLSSSIISQYVLFLFFFTVVRFAVSIKSGCYDFTTRVLSRPTNAFFNFFIAALMVFLLKAQSYARESL